jgi:hypothetical protein
LSNSSEYIPLHSAPQTSSLQRLLRPRPSQSPTAVADRVRGKVPGSSISQGARILHRRIPSKPAVFPAIKHTGKTVAKMSLTQPQTEGMAFSATTYSLKLPPVLSCPHSRDDEDGVRLHTRRARIYPLLLHASFHMLTELLVSTGSRSPGLSLNFSSNNPFRNRTASPTLRSPGEAPPRPISRNPFLVAPISPTMTTENAVPAPLTGNAAELFVRHARISITPYLLD